MTTLPRRFHLDRHQDPTGGSGTGQRIVEGVQFTDGRIALRWRTATNSTAVYDSITDVMTIHGHDGATQLVWDDPEPTDDGQPAGSEFARGFRLHSAGGDVFDGALFPSRRWCAVDHPERGLVGVGINLDDLLADNVTHIEWADASDPDTPTP